MTEPPYTPKPIAAQQRLIFALDVPDAGRARALVQELGDAVAFYKVGLELAMSGDYFSLIDWLAARGKRVFADLKLHDIPATVERAVGNLRGRGITFLTVHADAGVMRAAAEAADDIQILAVTVLTSIGPDDLARMGYAGDLTGLVVDRAAMALEAGCEGVIASAMEAPALRRQLDHRLRVVTPGIRPRDNRAADDQKRVVDVAQAFRNGADHIVVGRPIRDAPDPRRAALEIQATIAEQFAPQEFTPKGK